MTQVPHNQQCKTCDFAKITVKTWEDYGDIHEIFCTKINRNIDLLTCDHPHWFFYVGCASHSAEQSERDKVLNELVEKVESNWEFLFGVLPYNDSVNKLKLLKWIESLRSKQEETGGE